MGSSFILYSSPNMVPSKLNMCRGEVLNLGKVSGRIFLLLSKGGNQKPECGSQSPALFLQSPHNVTIQPSVISCREYLHFSSYLRIYKDSVSPAPCLSRPSCPGKSLGFVSQSTFLIYYYAKHFTSNHLWKENDLLQQSRGVLSIIIMFGTVVSKLVIMFKNGILVMTGFLLLYFTQVGFII